MLHSAIDEHRVNGWEAFAVSQIAISICGPGPAVHRGLLRVYRLCHYPGRRGPGRGACGCPPGHVYFRLQIFAIGLRCARIGQILFEFGLFSLTCETKIVDDAGTKRESNLN